MPISSLGPITENETKAIADAVEKLFTEIDGPNQEVPTIDESLDSPTDKLSQLIIHGMDGITQAGVDVIEDYLFENPGDTNNSPRNYTISTITGDETNATLTSKRQNSADLRFFTGTITRVQLERIFSHENEQDSRWYKTRASVTYKEADIPRFSVIAEKVSPNTMQYRFAYGLATCDQVASALPESEEKAQLQKALNLYYDSSIVLIINYKEGEEPSAHFETQYSDDGGYLYETSHTITPEVGDEIAIQMLQDLENLRDPNKKS